MSWSDSFLCRTRCIEYNTASTRMLIACWGYNLCLGVSSPDNFLSLRFHCLVLVHKRNVFTCCKDNLGKVLRFLNSCLLESSSDGSTSFSTVSTLHSKASSPIPLQFHHHLHHHHHHHQYNQLAPYHLFNRLSFRKSDSITLLVLCQSFKFVSD